MRDALGCEQAEFIGYWYENCPVKAREEGVYVSCYRRRDGSLIAAAANLTEKKQTVHLESAEPGVRLPDPFVLDSQDFRLIDLKPGR